jgi:hypothetical protein
MDTVIKRIKGLVSNSIVKFLHTLIYYNRAIDTPDVQSLALGTQFFDFLMPPRRAELPKGSILS